MAKIGVFICWCGENIGRSVDCAEVARYALTLPGVVFATDYKYVCSDPGQKIIKEAIKDNGLTGVVCALCSPKMHETTFQRVIAEAGLNPYQLEIANLREHCSWVHDDPTKKTATPKAKDLVRIAVEKVKRNTPLFPIEVPITKRAVVIGGGISGIQAALDIAATGHEVVLVEREASIGGHMAQLSETFPTLDCSQCILTPKMVDVAVHPRIRLMAYSEIEKVAGFIGNFEITIRRKATYVDHKTCTGCGACTKFCPVAKSGKVLSEFDTGLGTRGAIYVPFAQAVPNKPVIDRSVCTKLLTGKCGICAAKCPKNCINFKDEDRFETIQAGAVVVATGYDMMDSKEINPEYGGGRFKDVIDGLQFERLASASGPTGGEIFIPSTIKTDPDGKVTGVVPQTIVFITCVGSRDNARGRTYCSKVCCMYTAKHTMLYRHKVPDGHAYVFYMDTRAAGKNYDEFWRRAIEEDGAIYMRGRVSRIYRKAGKYIVKGMDTLVNLPTEVEADLVVLATAIVSKAGVQDLARKLNIPYDLNGFLSEVHPKLRPVETSVAGVFLAGAAKAPMDIPDAVAHGSAAAVKVCGLFSSNTLKRDPLVAVANQKTCAGCFMCESVCPYHAVERREIRDRSGNLQKTVANVNSGVCQGCGSCVAVCPSKTMELNGFTDEQLSAEISALFQWQEK